jgi:two-component system CheB/CheR fusion protein
MSDDREVHELFRDLLIGVTGFFRDPQAFESLNRNVLPGLLRDRPENERVRIWIPGCSTGEEAYTLAILLAEHLQKIKRSFEVQIFARTSTPGPSTRPGSGPTP